MAWKDDADQAVLAAETRGEEFLPLELAATVTYYRLTEIGRQLRDVQLGELRHFAAIALSTVAPIFMRTSAGTGSLVLTPTELKELLFRPPESGAPPSLEGLQIRKADMERGIEALKLAKNAFLRTR